MPFSCHQPILCSRMKVITCLCFALTMVVKCIQAWTFELDRRSTLLDLLQLVSAMNLADTSSSTGTTTETTKPRLPPMPENVEITDKVFIDVRVARKDGSTYVRDDLPDTFENTVLFQRITLGLFGKLAPNHVENFLKYIDPPKNIDNTEDLFENPYPSYSRSTFPSLDQETGLLIGGNIPSLRVKDISGTAALTYGNRVFPAKLWIDRSTAEQRISHSTRGLLTHKNLEVLPIFGITTRSQPSLDFTHTVFGQVMWDDDTLQFFRDLEDKIPTYSVERPSGLDDFNNGDVATTVFNAQREFFRGAAKTLGDDRVNKLNNGKLMRRMEVIQVGRVIN